MRISELGRRSGVPVATIKYYLREGLLPPGVPTAANQASYDDGHLRRLRLVRALIGVRGLSVAATREIMAGVDAYAGDTHLLLGLVLGALPPDAGGSDGHPGRGAGAGGPGDPAAGVDALVAALGWRVSAHAPARRVVADTLATLRAMGEEADWRLLLPYAELAAATAELDLDRLARVDEPLARAERALLLTVLLEPALLALRRLAQEHESARRYGAPE
ncbi:transcriptional regulator [Pilimelia anulata]|uniref:Transcriptional regulator n=1 Tax=Pilimelia anulata TaxID=53371 RepID=A0A8J3B8N9_9ACTN|nr:MerR family transcriptional regulator [Pilimelia anulata]GGJ93439.1 transcriptional regulator [Pilimelia anulata]